MRAIEVQAEAVRHAVAPAVAALGCSVYDVEVTGAGRSRTVRVTIEREGGVDLETIEDATRSISPALDDLDALAGPFVLEVSSPGVERTLRRPEHFAGAIGSDVTVKFHTEAGPRRVRGVLVAAGESAVTVDVDGEAVTVPYGEITQARTVFEWGPQPRHKSRARAKEKS